MSRFESISLDDLFILSRNNEGAKAHLIERIAPVLWKFARRYQVRGHEPEDLYQIAALAVLESIEKYDRSRSKALTYIHLVCKNTLGGLVRKDLGRKDIAEEVTFTDADSNLKEHWDEGGLFGSDDLSSSSLHSKLTTPGHGDDIARRLGTEAVIGGMDPEHGEIARLLLKGYTWGEAAKILGIVDAGRYGLKLRDRMRPLFTRFFADRNKAN